MIIKKQNVELKISNNDLLWNFIKRTARYFLEYGAKIGFASGWAFSVSKISVSTIVSTIPYMVKNAFICCVIGAIGGVFIGIMNGLALYVVTQLFYRERVTAYRVVTFLCFVGVSFVSTLFLALNILPLDLLGVKDASLVVIFPVVLAMIIGGYFSQPIAIWYLKEKRGETNDIAPNDQTAI